ncbi:MAG: response regulator transcription factor [Pseudomonadota bacterium]
MLNVLIADDHDLVRETIAAFLEAQNDVRAELAPSLDAAITCVAATEATFDLALLDYNMPGMNGLEGLERLRDSEKVAHVAIMSGAATRQMADSALESGAVGFLPKTLPAKSLANAIRFMAAGETYVPYSFLQAEDAAEPHPLAQRLSTRELEVLGGLCRGLANKEIARELDLQEVTIKLHVKSVTRKLDARNRTHAAMIAKEHGLF